MAVLLATVAVSDARREAQNACEKDQGNPLGDESGTRP